MSLKDFLKCLYYNKCLFCGYFLCIWPFLISTIFIKKIINFTRIELSIMTFVYIAMITIGLITIILCFNGKITYDIYKVSLYILKNKKSIGHIKGRDYCSRAGLRWATNEYKKLKERENDL